MNDLIQQIINGISLGAVYGLIAVGFSLVYGVLGLVNFAHGDVLMSATFLTLYCFQFVNMPLWAAAIIGILGGAIISILVELFTNRPVRNAPRLIPMITTLGAALVIRSIVQATAGSTTRTFPAPVTGSFMIGQIRITYIALVTIAIAVLAVLAFGAYLKYFKSGYGIRASAQDLDAAALMGVSINKTILLMFAGGGALGALGGLLYSMQVQAVYIGFGFAVLMKGFCAAILGGIGNLKGALLGGLILGVVEAVAGQLIGTTYLDAVAFGLLIIVLLVKPNGILGAQVQERV